MSNSVSRWWFWCLSELVAVLAGAGVGALIGLVDKSAGIVASVGTGMAMSFLIGVLARLPEFTGVGWGLTIPIAAGSLAGAMNLALAAILAPLMVWNIVWPDKHVDWVSIGAILGAIGGFIGGAVTGTALIRLLRR
ncbi:MAG: hypothetical protein QNJ46_03060 [Leptolyngbyaceae cyanobacterium MO_188.B28]|nr:hypothetical protein [Leptolyngbyaceae cyanobacterium MO_188.B28]